MKDRKFYVYSELDPGCSCCSWCYDWEEWETYEEAQEYVESLKEQDKFWSSTIIHGLEID